MNIFSIILARGGSVGVPNKNIKLVNGIPLIAHTIKQCLAAGIKEIYTSSDDQKILSLAESFGSKIIKRPDELATSTSTSEDAWMHAIQNINNIDIENDWIFAPQVTSPIRSANDIRNAYKLAFTEKYDSLLSVVEFDDFFLWHEQDHKLKPLNHDYNGRKLRQQIKEKTYLENGSFYMFKGKGILNSKNRLHGRIGKFAMDKYKMFQIDEPEDIKISEYFINYYGL